ETVDLMQPTGGQDPPPQYSAPGGGLVTQLWTGDIRVEGLGQSDWSSKGQVAIQMPLPLPLEVTAVFPEYLPGDLPEADRARQPQAPARAAAQPPAPYGGANNPGPG